MPVQAATSDSVQATQFGNERKIDRCQNGVLWAFYSILPTGSTGSYSNIATAYSTDNGVTWNAGGNVINGSGSGFNNYPPQFSIFIDLDDYAHIVFKDFDNGFMFYRRGTPNAGRTAWTWSTVQSVAGSDANYEAPDIVAHRQGTGWKVHCILSRTSAKLVSYSRLDVTSGGTINLDVTAAIISNTYSLTNNKYPSIDFNHTGDGKTVAGETPHLYAGWSSGNSGAGEGIRFKKATYSAGTWTWGTEREIDSTRFINSNYDWLSCLFDGTRVIICGMVYDAANRDVILHERDAADTTTTTRVLLDNVTTNDLLYYGSMTYDSLGNVYIFGRDGNGSNGARLLKWRKWTRSGSTLGATTTFSSVANDTPFVSVKRGYSNSRIEFIYLTGSTAPYGVVYDSITLNQTPNVPTALTVTSDVLDTTPVFSADISDPDSSQQIKGRFQIYQSDGTTLVGTIDSALRTGAGTVTAEYASALPVGTYKVQAATVDDAGAISAYTAQTTFYVKTQVTDDSVLRWDVDELIIDNLDLRWNVVVSNQKDLILPWNVKVSVQANDLTLRWSKYTPWTNVDPDPESPVTWEKVLA